LKNQNTSFFFSPGNELAFLYFPPRNSSLFPQENGLAFPYFPLKNKLETLQYKKIKKIKKGITNSLCT
jgi:hypothetical protein